MIARTMKPAARAGAAALVVALAACSGGGTSGVLPASAKHAKTAPLAFTMHWPSAQTLAKVRASSGPRRPSFISPKTQSVVVEVNDDSTLTTTANKPAQGNLSTVSVNAPIGNDSITITTWDQPNGGGNLLGQITVSQTIVAGQTNTVNATVDGVMEKIGISAAPSPFLETSTDQTGNPQFALVGTVAQTFTVVPEDVDGDVIVPPGDAPTLSMSSNDPSISVTPVSGKDGQYTVQAANVTQGTGTALKVQGSDGLGDTLAAQFAISELAAIYAGYAGPNGTSIVVYDQAGKPVATTGSFSGISDASAIAYDAIHKRLLVADAALGTVAAFDTQGNADSTFTQSAINGANGVVYDPDNDQIYVTQGNLKTVTALTGSGAPVTLSGTPFAGMSNPSSITYDPNLYGRSAGPQLFAADAWPGVTVEVPGFNPDGTASATSMNYQGTDQFYSTAVAYDSLVDKVFVVGSESSSNGPYPILREFDPNWGNIPMITATSKLNQPFGIAFNPVNAEIYVTNNGDGSITAFHDNTGSSTFNQDTSVTFAPPNGQTRPEGIAIVF